MPVKQFTKTCMVAWGKRVRISCLKLYASKIAWMGLKMLCITNEYEKKKKNYLPRRMRGWVAMERWLTGVNWIKAKMESILTEQRGERQLFTLQHLQYQKELRQPSIVSQIIGQHCHPAGPVFLLSGGKMTQCTVGGKTILITMQHNLQGIITIDELPLWLSW